MFYVTIAASFSSVLYVSIISFITCFPGTNPNYDNHQTMKREMDYKYECPDDQ